MGIALRRRAVASYMRRLQYLQPCQSLSIEDDAWLHVVGLHLCILSYHGQAGSERLFGVLTILTSAGKIISRESWRERQNSNPGLLRDTQAF